MMLMLKKSKKRRKKIVITDCTAIISNASSSANIIADMTKSAKKTIHCQNGLFLKFGEIGFQNEL